MGILPTMMMAMAGAQGLMASSMPVPPLRVRHRRVGRQRARHRLSRFRGVAVASGRLRRVRMYRLRRFR